MLSQACAKYEGVRVRVEGLFSTGKNIKLPKKSYLQRKADEAWVEYLAALDAYPPDSKRAIAAMRKWADAEDKVIYANNARKVMRLKKLNTCKGRS